MKRMWPLIIVLFSLLTSCQREQTAVLAPLLTTADDTATTQLRDRDQTDRQTAVFSDPTDIYRICSSRPQRILTSQVAKQERTQGKTSAGGFFKYSPSKKHHFGGRGITFKAPFRFAASCDYYVIALRRILR